MGTQWPPKFSMDLAPTVSRLPMATTTVVPVVVHTTPSPAPWVVQSTTMTEPSTSGRSVSSALLTMTLLPFLPTTLTTSTCHAPTHQTPAVVSANVTKLWSSPFTTQTPSTPTTTPPSASHRVAAEPTPTAATGTHLCTLASTPTPTFAARMATASARQAHAEYIEKNTN